MLLDITQLIEWSLYLLEGQCCGSETWWRVEWGAEVEVYGWVVLASRLPHHLS